MMFVELYSIVDMKYSQEKVGRIQKVFTISLRGGKFLWQTCSWSVQGEKNTSQNKNNKGEVPSAKKVLLMRKIKEPAW